MSGESGDLDEISRQKRSCVLAISLLRIFLTNSPDMCSGAVFEEGVDILLRGIEETHEGQQWLLRNEQPSLIILQTMELLIREGKEVSRRFLRQQHETADRLVHKCEQLLTVKEADTRVFSSILNIVELFYADHDATSQTNTSCTFGRFDDTRRFCLRFVPMLSKKTGVFRSGDDLLLRSVHLLSKLVAGMPKGGVGGTLEGSGTAVARKDSLGSTYSSDVNMQSEEDNSAFHRGRASSNDSVTVAGINSSTRFAAPTADEKTVFAYVLGGKYYKEFCQTAKTKSSSSSSTAARITKTASDVPAYEWWFHMVFDETLPEELRFVVLEKLVVRFDLPAEYLADTFTNSSGTAVDGVVVTPCGKQVIRVLSDLERCDMDVWFRSTHNCYFAVEWLSYLTAIVGKTQLQEVRKKFFGLLTNRGKLIDKVTASLRWSKCIANDAEFPEKRFPLIASTSEGASGSKGSAGSAQSQGPGTIKSANATTVSAAAAATSSGIKTRDFSSLIQQQEKNSAQVLSHEEKEELHSSQTLFVLHNVLKFLFLITRMSSTTYSQAEQHQGNQQPSSLMPLIREITNSSLHLNAILGILRKETFPDRFRSASAVVLGLIVCHLSSPGTAAAGQTESGAVTGRQLMELITTKVGLEDFNHFLRKFAQGKSQALFDNAASVEISISGSSKGSSAAGNKSSAATPEMLRETSPGALVRVIDDISRAMVAVFINDDEDTSTTGQNAADEKQDKNSKNQSATATTTSSSSFGFASATAMTTAQQGPGNKVTQNLLKMQEQELNRFAEENRQLKQEIAKLQKTQVDREKLSLSLEIDALRGQTRNLQAQCDLHLLGYWKLEQELLERKRDARLRESELTEHIQILCVEVEQLRRDLLEQNVDEISSILTPMSTSANRSSASLLSFAANHASSGSTKQRMKVAKIMRGDADTTTGTSSNEKTQHLGSTSDLLGVRPVSFTSNGTDDETVEFDVADRVRTSSHELAGAHHLLNQPRAEGEGGAPSKTSVSSANDRTRPKGGMTIDTTSEMVDNTPAGPLSSRTIEELRTATPLNALSEEEVESRLCELRDLITLLHDEVPETRKYMAPVEEEAIRAIAGMADRKYHTTLGNLFQVAQKDSSELMRQLLAGGVEKCSISEREEFLLSSFFKDLFDKTKLDRKTLQHVSEVMIPQSSLSKVTAGSGGGASSSTKGGSKSASPSKDVAGAGQVSLLQETTERKIDEDDEQNNDVTSGSDSTTHQRGDQSAAAEGDLLLQKTTSKQRPVVTTTGGTLGGLSLSSASSAQKKITTADASSTEDKFGPSSRAATTDHEDPLLAAILEPERKRIVEQPLVATAAVQARELQHKEGPPDSAVAAAPGILQVPGLVVPPAAAAAAASTDELTTSACVSASTSKTKTKTPDDDQRIAMASTQAAFAQQIHQSRADMQQLQQPQQLSQQQETMRNAPAYGSYQQPVLADATPSYTATNQSNHANSVGQTGYASATAATSTVPFHQQYDHMQPATSSDMVHLPSSVPQNITGGTTAFSTLSSSLPAPASMLTSSQAAGTYGYGQQAQAQVQSHGSSSYANASSLLTDSGAATTSSSSSQPQAQQGVGVSTTASSLQQQVVGMDTTQRYQQQQHYSTSGPASSASSANATFHNYQVGDSYSKSTATHSNQYVAPQSQPQPQQSFTSDPTQHLLETSDRRAAEYLATHAQPTATAQTNHLQEEQRTQHAQPTAQPEHQVEVAAQQDSAPEQQLQPGWGKYATEDGDFYYFNTLTGESSWDPPPGFVG
ncbi:unnamed protein product [Amoebophrya sp. A120]|nr:unnamed protein product [Amoebophrya sp. A120]|eukprot:GSA120T00012852001.1